MTLAEDLKAVLEDKHNVPSISRLVEQLLSPIGVVPWIGAGISVPLGYPEWTSLLLAEARVVRMEEALQELLRTGQYEEAAERLVDRLGEQQFQIRFAERFDPSRIEGRRCDGALALLPRLADGPVITTNFDRVLEEAFKQADRPFVQVIRGTEIDNVSDALTFNRRFLLKLHGDLGERTTRILTRSEFERHYGSRLDGGVPTAVLPTLMKRILISRPLLFLGCSLNQDRPLEILCSLNEEYKRSLAHYAILARPESDDEFDRRRDFLFARGICPIWFPPKRFDLIPPILEYLVGQRRSSVWTDNRREWSEFADIVEARIDTHARFLVGRDSELRRLDDAVEANGRGIVLVVGGPGAGKTSLLAHWIRSRRDRFRFACHFFAEKDGVVSVADGYLNLLRQLSEISGRTMDRLPPAGDAEGLRRSVYDLVRQVDASAGNPIVIVLDALDEASASFRPPFPLPLPSHVTVVASAKTTSKESSSDLQAWAEAAVVVEALGELDRSGVAAWLRAAGSAALAAVADDQTFLSDVAAKTHGLPLYLRYLTEDLAAAARSGEDLKAMLSRIPGGFQDYARQLLKTAKQGGDARQERLFAILSASPHPLREDDLGELTDLDPTDLDALPWKVTRWLDRRRLRDGTIAYAIAHPLLAEAFRAAMKRRADQALQQLIEYCGRWAEHRSPYALLHYPELLFVDRRREQLYALARNDAFAAMQRAVFSGRPALPAATLQHAARSAAAEAKPAEMAEFLLRVSRIVRQTTIAETPLAALRSGSVERARELAQLYEPERATLWLLLVAWELAEDGRRHEARSVLETLASTTLPHLSKWQGYAAAYALAATVEEAGDAFPLLIRGILSGEREISSLAILSELARHLTRQGRFDIAVETALEMVAGKPAAALEDIACAQAERGRPDAAQNTADTIQSPANRASCYAGIGAVLRRRGLQPLAEEFFASAQRVASSPELDADARDAALSAIATRLTRAGGALDALTTITLIEDPVRRSGAFTDSAAEARKAGGDPMHMLTLARTTADAIEDPIRKRVALRTVAAAYAAAGDAVYLDIARQIGTTEFVSATLLLRQLGQVLGDAGRFDEATALPKALGPLERRTEEAIEHALLRMRPQQLARAGRMQEAVALARSAGVPRTTAEILIEIAGVQMERGASADARATIGSALIDADAIDREPYSEALTIVAGAQADHGAFEGAEATIGLITDKYDRSSALAHLARLLANRGEFARAQSVASQLDGSYKSEIYEHIAVAMARAGDTSAARTLIDTIAPPKSVSRDRVRSAIAVAQAAAGKIQAALAAVSIMHHDDVAAGTIGAMATLDLPEGALGELREQAERLSPHDAAVALAEIAAARVRQGQDGSAEFAAALARAPRVRSRGLHNAGVREARVWVRIGALQFAAGDTAGSDASFSQALRFARWKSDVVYTRQIMAEELARIGRTAEALAHISFIDDVIKRTTALNALAKVAPIPPGFGEYAVQTAEHLAEYRDRFLPEILEALAHARDWSRFCELTVRSASLEPAAYRAAACLAFFFPDQAAALATTLERFATSRQG